MTDRINSMRFAHLSDPHFTEPSFTNWREVANKRLLSLLSWRFNRCHKYRREVFEALVRDALEHSHLLVLTGDLTQAGLEAECTQARDWLSQFEEPKQVCVIPGNHDSIYQGRGRQGQKPPHWQDMWQLWMGSEVGFPYLRVHAPVAFIGLSSAVPTAPFMASGRIDASQLAALPQVLRECREQELCRVLLVHHCPVPGVDSARRSLLNASALSEVIASEGVELVLHGHNHRWMRHELEVPTGKAPVLGAPSAASLGTAEGRYRAGYYLLEVSRAVDGWRIEIEARELCRQDTDGQEIFAFESVPAAGIAAGTDAGIAAAPGVLSVSGKRPVRDSQVVARGQGEDTT